MDDIFFKVTLPLMVTFVSAIWGASWLQNKRFDDLNKRMDEVIRRLDRIEQKFEDYGLRIIRLEERTSPLHK
jgi:hypothetical protein